MSNYFISEKSGQTLRAEYFQADKGAGVRFFINEELVKEEIYEGHNIHYAKDAAENWVNGIKILNG